MKINELLTEATKQRLDAKCWKGKHKEGTKMKGGVRVNNCVPNESIKEGSMKDQMHKDAERMSREKFVDKYGDENGEFWDNIMGDLDESVKKGLYYNVNKRKKAGTSRDASSAKAPTAQAWKDAAKTAKKEGVAEVAGAQKCWPGHRKVGTQPGTGKNAGKRVNDCEKIKEDPNEGNEFSGELAKAKAAGAKQFKVDGKTYPVKEGEQRMSRAAKGHEKYGKAGMAALAKAGREGAGEEKLDKIRDKHDKYDESVDELARVLELSGLNLTADEQFDIIEDMVESLALEYGVDAEVIWEDFESVDDDELLESAAWRNKSGKSKSGGLNAKGVASYRRENPGSKLQTAVTTKPSKLKKGSKAAKRRKSFCARMGGVKGPMKKPNGKPTRKALALRKWNC